MERPPLAYVVSAAGVPADGRRVVIEADEETRRRLALSLGIPAVTNLCADLAIRPLGRRNFSVSGTVTASVVQTDVVTLQDVAQEIVESVEVVLAPAEAVGREGRGESVDGEDSTPPDLFYDGRIDVGSIVAEHVALGLDPYPRAAATIFEGYGDPPDEESPFAALARLKPSND